MRIGTKSPVRARSRVETAELVTMFEGRIFHTIFKSEQFPPS